MVAQFEICCGGLLYNDARPRWKQKPMVAAKMEEKQATDLWEARQLAAARSPPSPLHGEEDDSNQMVWGLQGFLVVGGMVVVVGRIARVVG